MITSIANHQIKTLRGLRQRKQREESGLCLIEGIRVVAEAIQLGAAIDTLIIAPALLTSEFGRALVEQHRHIAVLEVSPEVFQSLSGKERPQGIAAAVQQRWQTLYELPDATPALWVALDAVADPGNLGTIMRTCDAVGAGGVILLGEGADPYDPTAVRASMGAVFSLALVRASFAELAAWAAQSATSLVGATGAGALDYQAYSYPQRVVLLMGSERQGLAPEQLAGCAATVRIPMAGRSDSLNLAVATSVILYEMFNQRRQATDD